MRIPAIFLMPGEKQLPYINISQKLLLFKKYLHDAIPEYIVYSGIFLLLIEILED